MHTIGKSQVIEKSQAKVLVSGGGMRFRISPCTLDFKILLIMKILYHPLYSTVSGELD